MKTKQSTTKMTQSKKNLEKHISGLRNPANGRLLIDQRGRRWSADGGMLCNPGKRLSQKWEWPGRAQTDKRSIGSSGGPLRPWVPLCQLLLSALLQPETNQPFVETDGCSDILLRFPFSSRNLGTFALMTPLPSFPKTYPSSYCIIRFNENNL